MKRKRTTCISDLNTDVIEQVMCFLGKSVDGYANIARAASVCKQFKKFSENKDFLKDVCFNEKVGFFDGVDSFWNKDGLLSKCVRSGNKAARSILLRHVKQQLPSSRTKASALERAKMDFVEKLRAVTKINSMERSRDVALAWEDLLSKLHHFEMDSSVIAQHINDAYCDRNIRFIGEATGEMALCMDVYAWYIRCEGKFERLASDIRNLGFEDFLHFDDTNMDQLEAMVCRLETKMQGLRTVVLDNIYRIRKRNCETGLK